PKRTGICRAEITSRSRRKPDRPAPSPVRFRPEYGRECGTSCGIHQIAGFTTTGWLRKQSGANPSLEPIFPAGRESTGKSGHFAPGSTAWTADPEGFRRLGPKFPKQLSRDFTGRQQRTAVGGSASDVLRSRKWPFSRHFGAQGGQPGGKTP